MLKQGRCLAFFFLVCTSLAGCVGGVWTGATMVYDRHNVYKSINDYHLLMKVTNALYEDKQFKKENCSLDIAVFNGDILVAGHVPSAEMLAEANKRLQPVTGYRRFFKEISVRDEPKNTVHDGWITAKIRSHIFADATIDPKAFKVVTADRIVYLMGDVRQEEAEKVIQAARNTNGVERVVKILKYWVYQSKTPTASN